jgi:hypothetical protein
MQEKTAQAIMGKDGRPCITFPNQYLGSIDLFSRASHLFFSYTLLF